jgi:uncharacterized protein
MKILLLGATGMIGSRIAAEAAARGHQVTAVSRSGKAPAEDPGITPVAGDSTDPEAIARLAAGHDAAVSALSAGRDGSDPHTAYLALYRTVLDGLRRAGTGRLLVVGGAGSLQVDGVALVDQPGFPDAYKGEALAHREILSMLRDVTDLDWTYLSPAPEIAPGTRTGNYRTGTGDELLPDAQHITAEDFAAALVDELESHAHPHARISVAY